MLTKLLAIKGFPGGSNDWCLNNITDAGSATIAGAYRGIQNNLKHNRRTKAIKSARTYAFTAKGILKAVKLYGAEIHPTLERKCLEIIELSEQPLPDLTNS